MIVKYYFKEDKKYPIEATIFYETDIKSMQSNSKAVYVHVLHLGIK